MKSIRLAEISSLSKEELENSSVTIEELDAVIVSKNEYENLLLCSTLAQGLLDIATGNVCDIKEVEKEMGELICNTRLNSPKEPAAV